MKVLFFHIYPVNNWKEVTAHLLADVPHDDIFVHVSLPPGQHIDSLISDQFLLSFSRIKAVYYSPNSAHPEADAMEKFLSHVNLSTYALLTYMHSKGVTKPDSENVKHWTELMRYFIIDKMALCERVFRKGYLLYGVNRTDKSDFDADFFYAGNFVSVNLTPDVITKIRQVPIEKNYHGLEGFWGKLCDRRRAYNAFYSRIDHYINPFPATFYKSTWQRIRYSLISFLYSRYYSVKHFITRSV